MVAPIPNSPGQGPSRSREQNVVLVYRNNGLFNLVLPEVERQLRTLCNISLERVNFPELTTPPQMGQELKRLSSQSIENPLFVTDVSVRRGIRALNGTGGNLLSAAHSGILLDRCLATAVKELIAHDLRLPLLRQFAATPSAEERAKNGELNLLAERVFFEALLLPIVRAYPQHQYIIVAEKLLHHAPFVTYFRALQATFIERNGANDPLITPQLLAWEHASSILSLPRVPAPVLEKLGSVVGGLVQHPCDWLKSVLIVLGCPEQQIVTVESPSQLSAVTQNGERHLQVVIGDRHVLEYEKLRRAFESVESSSDLATFRAAQCLAGPTFCLPLENLITDLADAGILDSSTLSNSEVVRRRLAEAIVGEIQKQFPKA